MNNWIKCEDALPELIPVQTRNESRFVLISTGYGLVDIAFYREHTDFKRKVVNGWYLKEDRQLINDVIAWMPLPEPYKRGDEDDT